jgi:branched-chain amino acid transport system permease protein
VCLTGATAFVVGFAVLRLSGIAASIATFALLAITVNVYGNWDAVTGGASSIANIPVEVGPWLSVSFAILTTLLAFLHQISRYGLMLRATRDDAIAASASGISTLRVRLVAFVLSAICVGVGGALYANFLGILSVDAFYLSTTFLALAMLVVGGVGSLAGAVIGVLFITALTELFRSLENGIPLAGSMIFQLPHGVEEVVLGGIMILVLIFRPSGLMRGREMPSPFAE